MKRFTETNKWEDAWFFGLSPGHKLCWLYLVDKCDNGGVVEIVPALADVLIGSTVDWEAFRVALGDRVEVLPNGRWHLVKFVQFQYGPLNPVSNLHKSVIKCLDSNGIVMPSNGVRTLHEGSVKGPSKGKGKGKGKGEVKKQPSRPAFKPPTVEEVKEYCGERANGGGKAIDAEKFVDYYEARGWLLKTGKMKCWRAAVRTWERNEVNLGPNPFAPGSEAHRAREEEDAKRDGDARKKAAREKSAIATKKAEAHLARQNADFLQSQKLRGNGEA